MGVLGRSSAGNAGLGGVVGRRTAEAVADLPGNRAPRGERDMPTLCPEAVWRPPRALQDRLKVFPAPGRLPSHADQDQLPDRGGEQGVAKT